METEKDKTEPKPIEEPKTHNSFLQLALSGRGLGIIGIIISIIAIPVGHWWQAQKRNLYFYAHPVRSVIQRSEHVSDLKLYFKEQPIDSDVTTAQIALWNEGDISIKKENILRPIVVYTSDKSPILKATVRNITRDVTEVKLNEDNNHSGRLGVEWAILENRDGVLIQLTYQSKSDTRLLVDGVVEGQKQISQIPASMIPVSGIREEHITTARVLLLFFVVLVPFLAWVLMKVGKEILKEIGSEKSEKPLMLVLASFSLLLLMLLTMIWTGLVFFRNSSQAIPPFSF